MFEIGSVPIAGLDEGDIGGELERAVVGVGVGVGVGVVDDEIAGVAQECE